MSNMMILTQKSDTANIHSFFREFVINEKIFGSDIDFEKNNFLKKKLELLQNPNFIGKYVVVIKGEIVDKDADKYVLLKRVYKKYGYVPMLVEKISNEVDEYTTSPNFEL